ncbi:hypothetical protein [Nonomuraea sp. NPDC050310]|uniref:hypothetical protein n=1 Tax=Nonomuraea sp. NPDC050310 TaxID=3154935 RepID=UPI00340FA8E8
MATEYEVVGEYIVHIPVSTSNGTMLVDLAKGAILPEGVPQERIQHLLDSNLIAEVGKSQDAKATAKPAPRKSEQ